MKHRKKTEDVEERMDPETLIEGEESSHIADLSPEDRAELHEISRRSTRMQPTATPLDDDPEDIDPRYRSTPESRMGPGVGM